MGITVEVLLCRHGEAHGKGITGGGSDGEEYDLTEKGQNQAKQLGAKLKDLFGTTLYPEIIHSGMSRSKSTALLASDVAFEKQVKSRACPNLKEIHHGITEQISGNDRAHMWNEYIPQEIEKWKRENPDEAIPLDFKFNLHPKKDTGAECWNDVWRRAQPEVIKVVKEIVATQDKTSPKTITIAFHVHNAVMQRFWAEGQIEQGTYPKDKYGLYNLHWENKLLGNGTIDQYKFDLGSNKLHFEQRITLD